MTNNQFQSFSAFLSLVVAGICTVRANALRTSVGWRIGIFLDEVSPEACDLVAAAEAALDCYENRMAIAAVLADEHEAEVMVSYDADGMISDGWNRRTVEPLSVTEADLSIDDALDALDSKRAFEALHPDMQDYIGTDYAW